MKTNKYVEITRLIDTQWIKEKLSKKKWNTLYINEIETHHTNTYGMQQTQCLIRNLELQEPIFTKMSNQ